MVRSGRVTQWPGRESEVTAMPISERVLRKWRGEALGIVQRLPAMDNSAIAIKELSQRILTLTQELLDQALLRREETEK